MIKIALDNKGRPSRYILTSDNNLQAVQELVDHSSLVTTSLHSINELGKQLLKAAAEGDAQEIKSLLLTGSPFSSDWLGTNPLHLAAQNNKLEVCQVLLEAGISKDARNKVDRTPLHLAVYEGHFDVVEVLISFGADLNCKDMLNMTPLHWAVQNGHISVVDLLLRSGAEISAKNKFDLTPHDIAEQIGRSDISQLIEGYENIRVPLNATQNLVNAELLSNDSKDVVGGEDNNNDSESVAKLFDPLILNFDGSNNSEESIENRDNHRKEPVVNNLQSVIEHKEEEDGEDSSDKGSQPIKVESSSPVASFKLIDGVIRPVNEENDGEFSAFKLLQEHGITMIPNDNDETNILNTVMESGHSVVLTDVGKQMLNSVKHSEEKLPKAPIKTKKIITVTPEQFLAMTNGDSLKNSCNSGKIKVISLNKSNVKRVVMKKNKPTVLSNIIKVQNNVVSKPKTDLELVMNQLIEARQTIEEYKVKLKRKELEVDRYKMQLKLLMDQPS